MTHWKVLPHSANSGAVYIVDESGRVIGAGLAPKDGKRIVSEHNQHERVLQVLALAGEVPA